MRNPIRSETDAFDLALGGAGLTGASVALGAFVNPIAGGALFVGGLIGAFIWEISSKDPDRRQPLRDAAAEGRRSAPSTRRRVLVAANRTLQGEELAAALSNWLETGIVKRLRDELDIPVTHVIVDPDRALIRRSSSRSTPSPIRTSGSIAGSACQTASASASPAMTSVT